MRRLDDEDFNKLFLRNFSICVIKLRAKKIPVGKSNNHTQGWRYGYGIYMNFSAIVINFVMN